MVSDTVMGADRDIVTKPVEEGSAEPVLSKLAGAEWEPEVDSLRVAVDVNDA